MIPLHFKTIKCKLKDILKEGINYDYLHNIIDRANKITTLCYLFIRSYLLFLYEQDRERDFPIINIAFIKMAFKALSKIPKGGPKPNPFNASTLKSLEDFYNNHFASSVGLTEKFDSINLSYFIGQIADQMCISITNNIKYHYYDHIKKYVKASFKEDLDEKLKNLKNREKDKVRKEFNKKLFLLTEDIINSTTECPEEFHEWLFINRSELVPISLLTTTFEKDIEENSSQYLKGMIYINKYLEANNKKSFQIFPIKSSINNGYIKMNTSALIDAFIFKYKKEYFDNVNIMRKYLWNKYFDLSKLKLKNHSFNYEIATDGFAVSFSFIHNDDIETQKLSKERQKQGRKSAENFKQTHMKDDIQAYLLLK